MFHKRIRKTGERRVLFTAISEILPKLEAKGELELYTKM